MYLLKGVQVQQDHRKYCKRENFPNCSYESTGYSCNIAPLLRVCPALNQNIAKSGLTQTI